MSHRQLKDLVKLGELFIREEWSSFYSSNYDVVDNDDLIKFKHFISAIKRTL